MDPALLSNLNIKWKEIQILGCWGSLTPTGLDVWSTSWEWIYSLSLAGSIREGRTVYWSLNNWDRCTLKRSDLNGGKTVWLAWWGICRRCLDISRLLQMLYLREWWAEGPEKGRCLAETQAHVAMELFGVPTLSPDSCVAGNMYVKGKWNITKKSHQR